MSFYTEMYKIVEDRGLFGVCTDCHEILIGLEQEDYIIEFCIFQDTKGNIHHFCKPCGINHMQKYAERLKEKIDNYEKQLEQTKRGTS